VIIGTANTPGGAQGVAVVGNTAYVADGSGLQIIDVSNPESPVIIGTANTPGGAQGVAVVGNTAYVADGSEGLQVIDVSNPESPVIIGTVDTPDKALGVAVVENTVYVADGSEGLQVIDVSNPKSPMIIGGVDTRGEASDIELIGDTAYVAGRYGGLSIIHSDAIISFRAVKSFIVESETTISLTIPAPEIPGNYTLRVSNQYGDSTELPGAVTFVSPEFSDKLRTKAIIIAGGGSDSSNKIRESTEKAADHAYNALRYQGYSPDDINYLSSVSDLDGKIDNLSTHENLENAIRNWAKDEMATELTLFFVDHGRDGAFQINATEELTAEELYTWLNELQTDMSELKRVILIIDSCQSVSFIDYIKENREIRHPDGKERIIIASAAHDQPAWFLNNGTLSFSYQFWESVYRGSTLEQAFNWASDQMKKYQTPVIDENGDGIPESRDSLTIAKEIHLRRGYRPYTFKPRIFNVNKPNTLNGETSATLWANVRFDRDGSPMERVWAVITPPDFLPELSPDIPVTDEDIPILELADPDNDGVYEGIYNNFSSKGTYSVSFYAMNSHGLYSLPRDETATAQDISITIENVPEPITLDIGTSAMLNATLDCTTKGFEVTRVWAVITDPFGNIAETELYDSDNDGVFENQYNDFTIKGTYLIEIRATGQNGFDFEQKTTSVTQTAGHGLPEPDIYEEDDEPANAKQIILKNTPQSHNFHVPGDEDWVMFHADSGRTYHIRTDPFILCNPVIELFSKQNTEIPEQASDTAGPCETELMEWYCPSENSGIYHVRITDSNSAIFGETAAYDLEIYQPAGELWGWLTGSIKDCVSGESVKNALVKTDDRFSNFCFPDGTYAIYKAPGTFSVTVEAEGYKPGFLSGLEMDDRETVSADFELEPDIHIPDPTNNKPDKPVLSSPADSKTNVTLTPLLITEKFSDPDFDDKHIKTRWQISTEPDFSIPALDAESSFHLTALTAPGSLLDENTRYYWRVRFSDRYQAESEWSDPFSFTTHPNIIPPATFFQTKNRPPHMPLGIVSFRSEHNDIGHKAKVTFYFSEPANIGSDWYTYDLENGWTDYSYAFGGLNQDRKSFTLEFTDGKSGDADGAENGIIVNMSGLVSAPDPSTVFASDDDVEGTGCFIADAAGSIPNMKSIIAFVAAFLLFLTSAWKYIKSGSRFV
ncbi:MAG: hypothetical protein GY795_08130, partial [Desulfobacterales bacterium]|nr:hypothetical protein [Desulfobacterales bacterium]